jgi:hypothetical protein
MANKWYLIDVKWFKARGKGIWISCTEWVFLGKSLRLKVLGSMLSRRTDALHSGVKEAGLGRRGKLSFSSVAMEASASPMEDSEGGMALQPVLSWGKGVGFVPYLALPFSTVGWSSSQGQVLESSPVLPQLGKWMSASIWVGGRDLDRNQSNSVHVRHQVENVEDRQETRSVLHNSFFCSYI